MSGPDEGVALLGGQLVAGEGAGAVGEVRLLARRVTVELEQELLHLVQAHQSHHSTSRASGPRNVMFGK